MSDKEILDLDVGGQTIKDMTSISFLAWLSNKIDGLPAYKGATVELRMAITSPSLGTMPDLEKIRLVRKLLALDISL